MFKINPRSAFRRTPVASILLALGAPSLALAQSACPPGTSCASKCYAVVAGNSNQSYCVYCAAPDCDDASAWWNATINGCYGGVPPADPWVRMFMICEYGKDCSKSCASPGFLDDLIEILGRMPLPEEWYLIAQICSSLCHKPLPPPPPGHQILPMPIPSEPGVRPDGSIKHPSVGGPWDLNRNPFEPNWGAGGPVDLQGGGYNVQEVDLSLPAPGFRWTIGRTYNAGQADDAQDHYDSNAPQGWNWMQTSQPDFRIRTYTDPALDLIYFVYRADAFVSFKRNGGSSTTFSGYSGAAGVVALEESTGIDVYVYYDQKGVKTYFFGFDTDAETAGVAGMLWKIVDPAGNTAYVGDATDKDDAAALGYEDGLIRYAYDSAQRRYTYTYSSSAIGGTKRLESVLAETKESSSTWASPTGVVTVGEVEYEYYQSDSDAHGMAGDLKLVRVTSPTSESSVNQVRRKGYWYWDDAWSSTAKGHPHNIRYEVGFEGARKLDLIGDDTLDEDFIDAAEGTLKPYASAGFEYYDESSTLESRRIYKSWFDGECGCGDIDGIRVYEYDANPNYAPSIAYSQSWAARTQIQRPDDTYETHYFDGWGQPTSRVISDRDPYSTSPTPIHWPTKVVRDTEGQVIEVRTPANLDTAGGGYVHSTGTTNSSADAGLITVYERFTSGSFVGFIQHTKWKVGTGGTAYFDGTVDYTAPSAMTIGDTTLTRPFISSRREYTEAIASGTSGMNETTMSYAYHTGNAALMRATVTVTMPSVATGNNGSGSQVVSKTYSNTDGTLAFIKSAIASGSGERYTIDYYAYANGLVSKHIQDADTSLTGSGQDFDGITVPTGFTNWTSSPDVPLHLKTAYTHDAQGRVATTTLPDNRVLRAHHSKLADGRAVMLGIPREVSGVYYGPVSYSVRNHAGKSEFSGTIAVSSSGTSTALSSWIDEGQTHPNTALSGSAGTLARMSTTLYTQTGGKTTESRLYHAIPSSGYGSAGTNYDPTLYNYDDMGRLRRVKDPTGTISRSVFDALGRAYERWTGTNDTGLPGSDTSGTSNMVKTEAREFDGNGVGNSYLTEVTQFVESTTTGQRVTTFINDDRGRAVVTVNPVAPHQLVKHDNLGRVLFAGLYSSSSGLDTGDDPDSLSTNRVALSETKYDERGQVWKTIRHKINASTGASDDTLEALNWYSHRGELIKTDAEQLMKYRYDRLGRQTHSFTLAVVGGDTAYADADDVNGDQVIEEHQTVYQDPDGHAVMSVAVLRNHDDYGLTESTAELDTNADGDPLVVTASNLKGRVQISSTWYDDLDRPLATAVLGTAQLNESGGPSTYNRSSATSPPSRSDTELVTTTVYADDGTVDTVTDPMNRVTKYVYDEAGRQTKVINNHVDGTPSADTDQTISYGYTGGLLTTMTADLPSGETDQVTTYVYGVTSSDSPGASKCASNQLLRKVVYPDIESGEGDADHTVYYAYNAQGEPIYNKDQAGNAIETIYDDGGRESHRKVTTLVTPAFDGAVQRISTAYDSLGRVDTVTQYDNPSPGSGSATDQIQFTYDGWGNMTDFTQDVDGVIGAGGRAAFAVNHAYAKNTSGRNTVRRTSTTLPGNVTMSYSYLSNGDSIGDDGPLSRVTRVSINGTAVGQYKYLGAESVVGTTYPVINVFSRLYGTSSSSYPDYVDRFGRVKVNAWTKDLTTDVNFYDVRIAYDRNSNVTSIDDQVQVGFDYGLTNDALNRLTTAEQGSWTGSAITGRTRNETWNLTQTGNWKDYYRDLNGDNNYTDSGEFRAIGLFNDVNEQNQRGLDTTGDGTADTTETLTYDKVGNMTDNGESHTFVYDAFGRLRFVKTRGGSPTVVSEHRYNGLGYRIGWNYDVTRSGGGDPDGTVNSSDPWYYFTYDDRWRIVATFRGSDAYAKERFFHHNAGLGGDGDGSYIDAVILRDRDASTVWTSAADSTTEERVYYCQNWRADVVSLLKNTTGGSVEQLEGVRYTAYGVPFGLPKGDVNSDGVCDLNDYSEVATWHGTSAYDARGDIDLDGDVDTDDETAVFNASGGELGLGQLSLEPTSSISRVGNRLGYSGYTREAVSTLDHARHRAYDAERGRWTRRDPLGHVTDMNLYAYVLSQPIVEVDPWGLVGERSVPCAGGRCGVPVAPALEEGDSDEEFMCAGVGCELPVVPGPGDGSPTPIYCSGTVCSPPAPSCDDQYRPPYILTDMPSVRWPTLTPPAISSPTPGSTEPISSPSWRQCFRNCVKTYRVGESTTLCGTFLLGDWGFSPTAKTSHELNMPYKKTAKSSKLRRLGIKLHFPKPIRWIIRVAGRAGAGVFSKLGAAASCGYSAGAGASCAGLCAADKASF